DSILYVNQNTTVRLEADRQAKLTAGEVFVEVSPRAPDTEGSTFQVTTPDTRHVTALGTKFGVQYIDAKLGVAVTQGQVEVGGRWKVDSGTRMLPQAPDSSTSPRTEPLVRATHLLDWTRDLMAEAESPLVPASQHCGGSLIAVDANGQEAK